MQGQPVGQGLKQSPPKNCIQLQRVTCWLKHHSLHQIRRQTLVPPVAMQSLHHVAMAAALMATTFAEAATVPLLGGPVDWHFSNWKAITDQIRGGVSTAELVPVEAGARFQGKLDPSKLHAGFAGMNLDVKNLPVNFSELSGLQLDVLDADGFEYTLLVKLKGAKEGTSYQVRFVPKKSMPFDAAFKEFQPYYRGHPDPSAPPLDKSQVETLAIQIASNFTGQSGAYKLDLQSISGYSFHPTEMFT